MPRFRWNRLTQFSLLGLMIAITLVAVGLRWHRAVAEQQALAPLRAASLKAAHGWWEDLQVNWESPRENAFRDYYLASNAIKDAEIALATTRQDRIQALTNHCNRVERVFNRIHALFVVGARGGEGNLHAEAELRLLEAKMLLTVEEFN